MDKETKRHDEQAQVHGARPKAHSVHSMYMLQKSQPQIDDKSDEKQYFTKSLSYTDNKFHKRDMSHVPVSDMKDVLQASASDREGVQQTIKFKISMRYLDDSTKQERIKVLDKICTLKDYMKWKFIISSLAHRDQLNVYIGENHIPVEISSNGILHVQMKVGNENMLQELCDAVLKHAMDIFGKDLQVEEIDIKDDKFKLCMQQLKHCKHDIYVEVFSSRFYIACKACDQKMVLKLIKELTATGVKQLSSVIEEIPVWTKLTQLVDLEKLLMLHYDCTELKVSFQTLPNRFTVTLSGSEGAVNEAMKEFKQFKTTVLKRKCRLQITTVSAIPELEVDKFLDDFLSKTDIKCVTYQKKESIYIYGFHEEAVKKALYEIERLILEKTCIIKGELKHNTDLLVSYVKQTMPGLVVLHFEESGLLHIVGVKQYVEAANQVISDVMNGQLTCEELRVKQSVQGAGIGNNDVSPMPSTYVGSSHERKLPFQDQTREQTFGKSQKGKHQLEVENDENAISESVENIDIQRSSDDNRMKTDFKSSQTMSNQSEGTRKLCRRKTPESEDISKTDMKHYGVVNDEKNEGSNVKAKINDATLNTVSTSNDSVDVDMDPECSKVEDRKDRQLKFNASPFKEHDNEKPEPRGPKEKRKESNEEIKKEGVKKLIDKTAKKSGHFTLPEASHNVTKDYDMSHPKHVEFMMKTDSRTFLMSCAENQNVTITQVINSRVAGDIEVTESAFIIPEETIKRSVRWKGSDKKILVLTTELNYMTASGSRLVNVKFKKHRTDKDSTTSTVTTASGVNVVIHLHKWIDEKGNEGELTHLLSEFISQTMSAHVDHIVIYVEAINGWPYSVIIRCVVSEILQSIFLNYINKSPDVVTLVLNKQDDFDKSLQYINKRMCRFTEESAKRAKQNQLEVIVISGELAKTKADVIVNTTSRDLDLSNGKVSSTILRAAGQGLQKECSEKYPNGISMSKHEVAVTGGHKLHCSKVFHIALDRYVPNQEMNTIESIRTFVTTCLTQASEMKYEEIAFPAIGTGILRYPVDLVAAAMFESVERFKSVYTDTTLSKVFFVIYPTNTNVMEIFKKHEESLDKPLEERKFKEHIPLAQIKISGLPENVETAESCILERCEDEVYSPSDMIENTFENVTFQQFLLLRHVYYNCKSIEMDHRNNCLIVSGKRKDLKLTGDEIEEHLKEVSKFHSSTFSVQDFNRSLVEQEVKLVDKLKDVFCIYDRINDIVYIYALSPKKIQLVRQKMIEKLSNIQHKPICDVSEPAASQDAFSVGVSANVEKKYGTPDSKLLEPSLSSDGHEDNRNITCHRKIPERQFSWTQDAKNIKIYQVDRLLVKVYEGDILCVPVDCIVNPANSNLQHNGGLAYSIIKAAGDIVNKESEKIVTAKGGHLAVAEVVRTSPGRLPYKCILHAVGPCWYDYAPLTLKSIQECLNQLRLTVIKCFIVTEQQGQETVAISTISSGLFGVPKELCAIQYAKAILELGTKTHKLTEVHVVDTNHDMIQLVQQVFDIMITQGQDVKLDLINYCQIGATGGETEDRKDHLENKTSDKPVNNGFDNERTDHNLVGITKYTNDGSKLKCKFGSNMEVHIYDADILKLQGIQVLVCSENRQGEARGKVSNQLEQTNGKDYKKEKQKKFKKVFDYGDMVLTSGGKSKFAQIIHAITPRNNVKALHMMYFKLFETLVKENINSVALPLLGTGSGKFANDEGAQVFLDEWEIFVSRYPQYILTIHLVLVDKDTSKLVKGIFRQHIDAYNSCFDGQRVVEQGRHNKSLGGQTVGDQGRLESSLGEQGKHNRSRQTVDEHDRRDRSSSGQTSGKHSRRDRSSGGQTVDEHGRRDRSSGGQTVGEHGRRDRSSGGQTVDEHGRRDRSSGGQTVDEHGRRDRSGQTVDEHGRRDRSLSGQTVDEHGRRDRSSSGQTVDEHGRHDRSSSGQTVGEHSRHDRSSSGQTVDEHGRGDRSSSGQTVDEHGRHDRSSSGQTVGEHSRHDRSSGGQTVDEHARRDRSSGGPTVDEHGRRDRSSSGQTVGEHSRHDRSLGWQTVGEQGKSDKSSVGQTVGKQVKCNRSSGELIVDEQGKYDRSSERQTVVEHDKSDICSGEKTKVEQGRHDRTFDKQSIAERTLGRQSVVERLKHNTTSDKQSVDEQGTHVNQQDENDNKDDISASESSDTSMDDDCVICMDKVEEPKKLKCGHKFCKECIDGYFKVKEVCPTCGQVCGVITGDQPDGILDIAKNRTSLAGYKGYKTIAVSYYFPPGKQGEMHPRPGAHYRDVWRTGYLPDNKEGREIVALLKVAFERRLVFTIGTSRTTGEDGVITWNDIHHKTDLRPNAQFGYPDETYFQRVREELSVKGVTQQDIDEELIIDLSKDSFQRVFKTDTSL